MTPLGQDRAVAAFRAALDGGHLHHAWLLAGPRGVGKGAFARAAALRLLAHAAGPPVDAPGLDTPDDHRIASLMNAGSHPDFKLIERELNDKGVLRRNITVDQIRRLRPLFELQPALSEWRAVVIDSIDEMEGGAANALLKLLEEPPGRSVFLLVSHAPGRLLPTIRSRCRLLEFAPLADDALDAVLRVEAPALDASARGRLIPFAGGSAARAIAYADLDLAPLAEEAVTLMRRGDPDNARRARLASSLALKAAGPRYAAFLDLVPPLVALEARTAEGARRQRAVAAWDRVRDTATFAPRHSLDPAATVFALGTILASVAD